ncbi:hypothetical protein AABB24_025801, partial [Solanum stoloniferum]
MKSDPWKTSSALGLVPTRNHPKKIGNVFSTQFLVSLPFARILPVRNILGSITTMLNFNTSSPSYVLSFSTSVMWSVQYGITLLASITFWLTSPGCMLSLFALSRLAITLVPSSVVVELVK